MTEQPEDFINAAFNRMREVAQEGGHRLPNLQRPPRKAKWAGFDDTSAARIDEELRSEDGVEKPVIVRDRAGTPIKESLLNDPGIRLHRLYNRKPSALGAVLNKEVIDRGWQVHFAHGVIMTEWDALVGETVAEHTQVREFKDGKLIVECQSSAWATQLRLAQRQLLKNIAERVGDGVVTELKILGPKAPNWRKGALHIKGRGPRDTYG